ncbi:MAG: 1-(5-phosphoribosyl)-5-[(5-phosphoribosylamino)methylideneamino]imidazole-4-carboxamide isomerase [Candidatus Altiarchaeales archaeon IMC4]|nr:MAG: 1-(5-phosphoribosyl)-5-[(5-phosphoribosylamino)methylideneamino]imidazole-4-carboxamide isomerase [Candidatus Altiarchaeales archaeon IMC4]
MRIIPAIDIKDGKCAQLVQGKPGTEKFYGNPVDIAKSWVEKGAEILHVIDLNAALGSGDNLKKVKKIREVVSVPIQFGGGIRTYEKATEILGLGIDRIILGTLAINELETVERLCNEFGRDRLIVAVDSKEGCIVVEGWQKKTSLKAENFMATYENVCWGFLFTDVDVEGMMQGIDEEELMRVVKSTSLPVIVSGGMSSKGDVRKAGDIGAWGVVLGKAVYEGILDFEDLV